MPGATTPPPDRLDQLARRQRSPCTTTTAPARTSRSTVPERGARVSSVGRSTATTAWWTSTPPSSRTATTSAARRQAQPDLRVSDTRRSLAPVVDLGGVGDFRDAGQVVLGSFLGWTPERARRRRWCPGQWHRSRPDSHDEGRSLAISAGPGTRPTRVTLRYGKHRRRPGLSRSGKRREGPLPHHPHDHRAQQLIELLYPAGRARPATAARPPRSPPITARGGPQMHAPHHACGDHHRPPPPPSRTAAVATVRRASPVAAASARALLWPTTATPAWTVRTASNSYGADRSSFSYAVNPGGVVQGHHGRRQPWHRAAHPDRLRGRRLRPTPVSSTC